MQQQQQQELREQQDAEHASGRQQPHAALTPYSSAAQAVTASRSDSIGSMSSNSSVSSSSNNAAALWRTGAKESPDCLPLRAAAAAARDTAAPRSQQQQQQPGDLGGLTSPPEGDAAGQVLLLSLQVGATSAKQEAAAAARLCTNVIGVAGAAGNPLTREQLPQQHEQLQQQQEEEEEEELYAGDPEAEPWQLGERTGEETPVIALGRCVSSDGWRDSSGSSSDDSWVAASPASEPAGVGGSTRDACANWGGGPLDEQLEGADADAWIGEAVRYMELVVQSSGSSTRLDAERGAEAVPAAAAAAGGPGDNPKLTAAACKSFESAATSRVLLEGAEARRPRSKTTAGDFAFSRAAEAAALAAAAAADNGEAMKHVFVLVLRLYKQLQQLAAQVDVVRCGCANCHSSEQEHKNPQQQGQQQQQQGQQQQQQQQGQQQQQTQEGSARVRDISDNGEGGRGSASRHCACCAFGTPLSIGAALSQLYRENPDRFSLLLHDSVLMALLPLQHRAAAALADALADPSPLVLLLDDGGRASQLLDGAAEATAARVLAAAAAAYGDNTAVDAQQRPQKQQQQRQQVVGGPGGVAGKGLAAAARKFLLGSTSSSRTVHQRRSWPECLWWPRPLFDVGVSYSCCGVSLCQHKRAAAKRFLQREQQALQHQMQHQHLAQLHLQQQQHLDRQRHLQRTLQQQLQQRRRRACTREEQQWTSAKEAEAISWCAATMTASAVAASRAGGPLAAAGAAAAVRAPAECQWGRVCCSALSESSVHANPSAGTCAACMRVEELLRLFDGPPEPPLSLGMYASRLQHLASVTDHELLMALLLLTHARQRQHRFRISDENAHRLLLAALVLVSKVVRDDQSPLTLWAVVGGVPPKELAAMETALLELLGHKVSFSLPEFAAVYCLATAVSHMQRQQEQVGCKPQQGQGSASAAVGSDLVQGQQAAAGGSRGERENPRRKSCPCVSNEVDLASSSGKKHASEPSGMQWPSDPDLDDSMLQRRFTYPSSSAADLRRPSLQENPVLKRLAQLQGVDVELQ